jgi:hypothetical protein
MIYQICYILHTVLYEGIENMPRFDDVTKGIALGLGVAILIPVAVKTLAPVLKPIARSAVKNGIRAVEKGREMLAETSEMVEDLVAETQAEMRAARFGSEDDVDESATMDNSADMETSKSTPSEDQSNVRNIVNE